MTREEAIQELKVMRLWAGLKVKKEAIDMAIAALREPEQPWKDLNKEDVDKIVNSFKELEDSERKWIPVSERLPKPNEAVLVCTNTGEIDIDYYGSWIKDFIGLKGTYMKAIAWQPLPEPYKAGDQE